MRAKLCSVTASNNRDHARNLSYYCLLAPRTYDDVVLHAHAVRGESHNQRNTTGEVATTELLSIIESRGTLDYTNRRRSLEQSQTLEVTVCFAKLESGAMH